MLSFCDSMICDKDYGWVYFPGLFMNRNSKDGANGLASLCERTTIYQKVKWQDEFNGRTALWHLPQTVTTCEVWSLRWPPAVWRKWDSPTAGDPREQQAFSRLLLLLPWVTSSACMTRKWHHFMGRLASRQSKSPNRLSFENYLFYDHKFSFTENKSHKLWFTEGWNGTVERTLEVWSQHLHYGGFITANPRCLPPKWGLYFSMLLRLGLLWPVEHEWKWYVPFLGRSFKNPVCASLCSLFP